METAVRVKLLIDSLSMTQKKFAETIGISPARLNNYLSGVSKLPQTILVTISSVHNVNLTWLLTGTGSMYNNVRAREDGILPKTVSIPIVASIAAGPCIEPLEDQPHQLIQVPVSLLTLPPPYWAFRVEGESMSPHIIQDDIVVLSRDWHSLDLHDRICGFRTPDGITLKKLMVQPRKKTAWLMPLNHSYHPQEYTRDTQDLTLIGVLVLLIRKYI